MSDHDRSDSRHGRNQESSHRDAPSFPRETYGGSWASGGDERPLQGPYGENDRHFGFGRDEPAKRAFRGPKGYVRSDERIREDVNERLGHQQELDPRDIEVSVANGDVTLAGFVQNRHEKFRAEEMADAVHGVREVENKLRIRPERSPEATLATQQSDTPTGAPAHTDPDPRSARP